ncbi:putative Ig domain-containing protein [Reichenbachiella versicolor]|uniref:putative Ig domain-containing protein n=1 Tax=Reichenbachiella versicolor TaxID=1821036 RepID=UPI000D6E0A7F|nr:putative Ig domain-containing protein [Reichenbachiella versicolor]
MKYNYHSIYYKYLKFKSRLDKAIQNGSFTNYTYKKRQMLLKRLDRLKRQLEQLDVSWKVAATGTMAAGMLLLNSPEANAQGVAKKEGSEFKLNATAVSGDLPNPSVAMDADGDFVITWGFEGSVYAQRYNYTGEAQGEEFLVDHKTGFYNPRKSAVAMSANGDFVITWDTQDPTGLDTDQNGIYAKRYNAAGESQGDTFLVNTYTTGNQETPAIAMDDDGDFVIAWSGRGEDTGGGIDIIAQRFDASGNKVGSEFFVNSNSGHSQYSQNPSVAMDSDGDFVIAWEDSYADASLDGIEARRYNAAGESQGIGIFRVNTSTNGNQRKAAVAMDSDGDFVVAWTSNHDASYSGDIYAQRFDASGVALDGEFLVNVTRGSYSNSNRKPTVAMNADGEFVISWDAPNSDISFEYEVYARHYNASGIAQSDEILVNTETSGEQTLPSIAIDDDGDFVIAYKNDNGGSDNVFAQLFDITRSPILPAIEDKEVEEESLVSFTAEATDANKDELTYSLDAPSIDLGMTINSETGEFSWTPSIDHSGAYDVTISVSDGDLTDSETFKITVTDKVAAPDGVSSVDGEILEDVTLFPNPATSEITLSSESSVFDSYEISDLSGGLVQTGNMLAQKSISIADLPTGVYMLKVSGVDGVKTIRFIKK